MSLPPSDLSDDPDRINRPVYEKLPPSDLSDDPDRVDRPTYRELPVSSLTEESMARDARTSQINDYLQAIERLRAEEPSVAGIILFCLLAIVVGVILAIIYNIIH